jgi:hypothetical protein
MELLRGILRRCKGFIFTQWELEGKNQASLILA